MKKILTLILITIALALSANAEPGGGTSTATVIYRYSANTVYGRVIYVGYSITVAYPNGYKRSYFRQRTFWY